MSRIIYDETFAFYDQLLHFYQSNRGKIRSRYNTLTRKYLAYNDKNENPNAFLRLPQFEALEMYVFIKEFFNNAQVYEIFQQWSKREGSFSTYSYYYNRKHGELELFRGISEEQTRKLFERMTTYTEEYPNYIYALTMGLGKTILMGTCIFYEFLLANKYPDDKRFCHNALVFAPDKTVRQSLKEIIDFDKTLVVPPEYTNLLNSMINYHFLDDNNSTLNTLDGSSFNIIISNAQKIIVKKQHKEISPTEFLFDSSSLLKSIYGESNEAESFLDEQTLNINQRFKKLTRLKQLGVYVDEAHHLFGASLESDIRTEKANKTSLRTTINLLAKETSIVACYNYTGTPYVNKQVLPEVVYGYGLKESIQNNYLKNVEIDGYENVKGDEFIRGVITAFWETYGNNTYENLTPKLAIFAATIAEATNELRPLVERVLTSLGINTDKILVNVGDERITKHEDIRNFNNLDVPGSTGNTKQFIILVGKGREGWNCRSLFGVALFRRPKSKIFVLQATMRCLRQITDEQQKATVFLSIENMEILKEELEKNFNMTISDLSNKPKGEKAIYKVRVLLPHKSIPLRQVKHIYEIKKIGYTESIDFGIQKEDFEKYKPRIIVKNNIIQGVSAKKYDAPHLKDNIKYSIFMLVGEIARYMNLSSLLIEQILVESKDGSKVILEYVNQYNEIIHDIIIPKIFSSLYKVEAIEKIETKEAFLLREPSDGKGYYLFKADPNLVVKDSSFKYSADLLSKSFHADTYCFDSKPEKELFHQYINSDKVKEIYFTGMFTSNQGDLFIDYYDRVSQRYRQYYPDFLAKMKDGSYQLIEVKGDNKIDACLVEAKKEAAEIIADYSNFKYVLFPGSKVMNTNLLDD